MGSLSPRLPMESGGPCMCGKSLQSCLTLCNPIDDACQASLSSTVSQSLLKLTSIESTMPFNGETNRKLLQRREEEMSYGDWGKKAEEEEQEKKMEEEGGRRGEDREDAEEAQREQRR